MNTSMSNIREKQQGIVSIMMTLVLIIIVSLIVLGLAQLSRREQSQSLDNQLSTQAFYAAESGLNDADAVIRNRLKTSQPLNDKTTCSGGPAEYSFNNVIGNASDGVTYSCLLVDTTPADLRVAFSSASSAFTLNPSGGSLDTLKFEWSKASGLASSVTNCPGAGYYNFEPTTSWNCPYAALRIDVVPGATLSRAALLSNNRAFFVMPTNGAGSSASYSGAPTVSTQFADCDNTSCQFSLTNMGGGSKYFLRVSALYYDAAGDLTISGEAGGSSVAFTGTQAQIDVTGKAQDVLRRISASIDISGTNQNSSVPAPLISGDTVCKRIFSLSGSTQPDSTPASYSPITTCP